MLKYLQIAQHFDAAKMQADAARLEDEFWQQHYNKSHYEGQWNILPLRSINGSVKNIIAVHGSANQLNSYRDTPLLENGSYLKTVLNFFQCEKTSVRLMRLHAGAVIKEHRDMEMSFEEGEARFHIPVVTNSGVEFFLDEERIVMQEGECWYLNLSLRHRVINCGTTDRVHLVIDCKVNDWLKNLFATQAILQKQIEEKKETAYSQEEKQNIIRELRLMNTPAAIELAAKMEKELY